MRANQDSLSRTRVTLALLGRFTLRVESRTVNVPDAPAKMLAALALHRRPMPRAVLAELLWPELAPHRPRANLRSVMWRLPSAARGLVGEHGDCLQLAPDVEVDVDVVVDRCLRVVHAPTDPKSWTAADASAVRWGFADEDLLVDLLPTWDDDWVLVDRARLRQLRLHALEALADLLVRSGRLGEAVDAASAALRHEPLRESAAVALVSAHLASGNAVEAHRTFARYRDGLRREMGLEPSGRLTALLPRGVSPTTTG
jgi:DNA-binding SARP family transcriptional activator